MTDQSLYDARDRVLYVTIPGIPRPQPRPVLKRVSKTKLRAISVADPKAKLWREGLVDAVRRALKEVGPDWLPRKGEALSASIAFRMPCGQVERLPVKAELTLDDIATIDPLAITANAGVTIELRVVPVDQYATARPDLDNLLKMVMDGLQEAGALGELDDCALVEVNARKIKAL